MADPSFVQSRPGRPRSATASSHAAVMDAVYTLLQSGPLRDLTVEAVAKQAGVGRPTIYKWWPNKSALVLAMFNERLVPDSKIPPTGSAEMLIRLRVKLLIKQFNGMFGKVMADLIAEGQADPSLLAKLYEGQIRKRRAATVAEVERGKAAGEFRADLDPELFIDAIFGPIYYHLLLRSTKLTTSYGNQLVDQALHGARLPGASS